MKHKDYWIFFLLLATLNIPFFLAADESLEKTMEETEEDFSIKDTLLFGIESEIQALVKEQKQEMSDEYMQILYERYVSAILIQTKTELVRYFTKCTKLPDNIINEITTEALSEDTPKELRLIEFSFLAKHGNQDSHRYLIEQLSQKDQITQQSAATAITKISDPSTALLVLERLKKADGNTDDATDDTEEETNDLYLPDEIKTTLIQALGEWKSESATSYLKKILDNETAGKFLQMYAMAALAKIGDLSAVELMREKLGSEEVKVREYAAASLASFQNSVVIPIYIDMLRHNDAKVRICACQGIAKNKDTTSINLLIYKFQRDPDVSVKNEALWTLLSLGESGVSAIQEVLGKKKLSPATLNVISTGTVKTPNIENVDFLKELYKKADKAGKQAIERNVYRTDSRLLDPILELLLQSEDANIRLATAGTLKRIPDTSLVNELKDLKENDPNSAVKRTAARTLEAFGAQ